jgi:hypothetical protein
MQTPAEIRERRSYLRDLLINQLGRFEEGALRMTTGGEDTSLSAITKLKQNIQDFDELIARSDARHGPPV